MCCENGYSVGYSFTTVVSDTTKKKERVKSYVRGSIIGKVTEHTNRIVEKIDLNTKCAK